MSDVYNPPGGIGRLDLTPNADGVNAANVKMFLPHQWTVPCATGFDVVFLIHGTDQSAQAAIDWVPNSLRQQGIIFIALNSGNSYHYPGYAVANGGAPGDPVIKWDQAGGQETVTVGGTPYLNGCEPSNDPACYSDSKRLADLRRDLVMNNPRLSGRFYVFGFSNGAQFVAHLMCLEAGQYAGFAFASNTISRDQYDETCGVVSGPGMMPGTRLEEIAFTFNHFMGYEAVEFGTAAGQYVKPVLVGGGEQDHRFVGDLGLDANGWDDEDDLGFTSTNLLVPNQQDHKTFFEWLAAREGVAPNLKQKAVDVLNGAGCLGQSCTTLTPPNSTTRSFLPFSAVTPTCPGGGCRDRIYAVDFRMSSGGGAAGATGNTGFTFVEYRGGEHAVPGPNVAHIDGFTWDFSLLERAVLLFKDAGNLTPVTGDADSDGFSCLNDCDDTRPTVHPGAAEICDGLDNDCDSIADNASPPVGAPSLVLGKLPLPTARLAWSAVAAATHYDITRGSVGALRASGGDYSVATAACLANGISATTYDDAVVPPVGAAAWYLVRAENCGGAASYDSGAASQVGSRDAEIQASGVGCP